MTAPVRLGIIGIGRWGMNLLRNFTATPGCEVVWAVDADPARVAATGLQLSMLTPSDAVVIATPPESHFRLAMCALRAGSHVLVTKPMCTNAADAATLAGEAASRGLVLAVDHTYAFNSLVMTAAAHRDSIGPLCCYESVRANLGRYQDDCDVLADLAVHDLSILETLGAGPPVSVSAVGSRVAGARHVDVARMSVAYATGLVAHVSASWLSPTKQRRIQITGERGALVIDETSLTPLVCYQQLASADGTTGDVRAETLHVDTEEALARMARHFVACVRGDEKPRVDGWDGARAVRVVEAAARSMALGGTPVGVQA